jgi:hypothetical protein
LCAHLKGGELNLITHLMCVLLVLVPTFHWSLLTLGIVIGWACIQILPNHFLPGHPTHLSHVLAN